MAVVEDPLLERKMIKITIVSSKVHFLQSKVLNKLLHDVVTCEKVEHLRLKLKRFCLNPISVSKIQLLFIKNNINGIKSKVFRILISFKLFTDSFIFYL